MAALAKSALGVVVPNAPFWLLAGLALAVWLSARRRRRMGIPVPDFRIVSLLGIVAVAALLLAMPVGPKLAAAWLEPDRPIDLSALGADAPLPIHGGPDLFVAVFGAGVVEAPGGGWQPSMQSLRRALVGRDAATRFGLPLAVSGGRVEDEAPAEADVIAETLALPETTRLDRDALNTADNGRGFAVLAAEEGWRRAVVVTDRPHLRRAAAALRAAGIEPAALLPTEPAPGLRTRDFVPHVGGFIAWWRIGYEALGLVHYLAAGRIAWSDL